MEKIYTSGEVAKYTGVNFRTVIRWIERGDLDGYKLPGRGDHRVRHSDLVQFMNKNEIPLPSEWCLVQKKALVVDDDVQMAQAIARIFKRLGWEVKLAHDGFEAGVLLAEFKPTIMTLDLKMPHMDGNKVLISTREKFSKHELNIIVISAQDRADLEHALSLGADSVLEKPFDNEQLKSLINHIEKM